MELCKRIIFSLYRRVPHLSLTIPRVPHPFAPLRKGEIRWDSISHVLNLNLTRQVSGHDFSILPDATAGSKGCVVVPKGPNKTPSHTACTAAEEHGVQPCVNGCKS
jgi:hypothetical protein